MNARGPLGQDSVQDNGWDHPHRDRARAPPLDSVGPPLWCSQLQPTDRIFRVRVALARTLCAMTDPAKRERAALDVLALALALVSRHAPPRVH